MNTAPLATEESPRLPAETVSVGALELDELKARWAAFQCVSDRNREKFDPVASLRCTGAVLDAVGHVIATAGQSAARPSIR